MPLSAATDVAASKTALKNFMIADVRNVGELKQFLLPESAGSSQADIRPAGDEIMEVMGLRERIIGGRFQWQGTRGGSGIIRAMFQSVTNRLT